MRSAAGSLSRSPVSFMESERRESLVGVLLPDSGREDDKESDGTGEELLGLKSLVGV